MFFVIADNVISGLSLEGKNIIEPWGIETADMDSFFSLQDGYGYRYKILDECVKGTERSFVYSTKIEMKYGKWWLYGQDIIVSNDQVIREASIECIEDSYFMDFVIRYRFKKEIFHSAFINGEKIMFSGSDKYHQYPVDEAILYADRYKIKVSILEYKTSGSFKPVMYVRDSDQDGWVVHVRMIPDHADLEVIKLCNKYCQTRPLPFFISNMILRNNAIKKRLYYAGEKKKHKGKLMKWINPNAFPMVRLGAGKKLFFKTKLEIIKNDKSAIKQ